MTSWVTGTVGLLSAVIIVILIRRDRLHVRFGLFWVFMALAFVVFGIYPRASDQLARFLGVASGPVLALTLAITVVLIKLLTMDIARSRAEARLVRLVQRVAMLEAELDRNQPEKETQEGPPPE